MLILEQNKVAENKCSKCHPDGFQGRQRELNEQQIMAGEFASRIEQKEEVMPFNPYALTQILSIEQRRCRNCLYYG